MFGKNKVVGALGEDMAEAFLKGKGFRILERNFSTRWGEIDLIAEEGRCLVFVEVKRRRNDHYGAPEEAVVERKKNHIAKAAMIYIQQNQIKNKMIRFDVVSVEWTGITHYPDAFMVGNEFYY